MRPSRQSVFDGVLTFFAITFRHGVSVLDFSLRAASNAPPRYSPADQLPFLFYMEALERGTKILRFIRSSDSSRR
jgi:hypothetical protein